MISQWTHKIINLILWAQPTPPHLPTPPLPGSWGCLSNPGVWPFQACLISGGTIQDQQLFIIQEVDQKGSQRTTTTRKAGSDSLQENPDWVFSGEQSSQPFSYDSCMYALLCITVINSVLITKPHFTGCNPCNHRQSTCECL